MPRPLIVASALAAAALAGLTSVAVTAADSPSTPEYSLPPPAIDRVGRAQIFDYRLKDKSVLIGRRDFMWASFGAPVPGVWSTSYMPQDMDLDRSHDVAWYRANHPTWLVYRCDGAPTSEYDGRHVSVDTTNPEVREALFKQGVVDVLAKRSYHSIGVDNLDNTNSFHECGVLRNGVLQEFYSGQRVDPSFAEREAEWMAWLAVRVHARGLALTGNLSYNGNDRASYLKILRNLDVVLDETGFERKCRPLEVDAQWLDRITFFRDVAKAKPLVVIEQVCPTLAEITPATITWSLANYLLIKQDRTYLALTPEVEPYGALYDFPELYLKLGSPLGPMAERHGVYFRQFQRVLALVNPSTRSEATFDVAGTGWRDEATGAAESGPVTLDAATAMVLVRSD
jgi:hypothetical protein